MHFIIIYKFQGIANFPNALGYKLKIFCSVSLDAVSKNGIVLNFSKSENFLGMYVTQFCKIMGKRLKQNLNTKENAEESMVSGLEAFPMCLIQVKPPITSLLNHTMPTTSKCSCATQQSKRCEHFRVLLVTHPHLLSE